jgi:phosphoglycolate phosphatase
MYKYILFDLDGTLIEHKEGITKCVAYALNKFGIKVKNLDDLTVFIGPPLIDSFMKYYNMSLDDAKLAVKFYRERFQVNGILECELYKNVEETLKKLKKENKILLIATSKPEDFTNSILKRLDIYKYFDLIVGATLDGSRGEKSGVIKYALDQINIIDLSEVIMVGDRMFDIFGAKKNNIDSIGVSYGYAIDNELFESNPTFIVNDIEDIIDIIC